MTEPQDISEKIDEVCRRRIRSVDELQQALSDLEKWATDRIAAIKASTRLTAEDYNTYIGPTPYNPRKLEP